MALRPSTILGLILMEWVLVQARARCRVQVKALRWISMKDKIRGNKSLELKGKSVTGGAFAILCKGGG